MSGDRGYARFFAYLNFFVFSMLLLVLASNFVLLIVGWAFVGAASYLLISFWYRRETATLGRDQGVRDQRDRRRGPRDRRVPDPRQDRDRSTTSPCSRRARRVHPATTARSWRSACCCSWAPSRSRPSCRSTPGSRTRWRVPTPVSALIHAATMVTAGVYLIARMFTCSSSWRPRPPTSARSSAPPRWCSPPSVAVVVTDLKRVIAYSTMSQIGYMVLGVSAARVRRRDVPPDDARLLQGAALHVRGLGDRRDGREPGPGQDGRLPQGDALHLRHLRHRVAALCRASRSPPGSSRRTRSSPSRSTAAAASWCSRVFGYLAAGVTAFYAFRLVFRVFYGEPVEEARELSRGRHGPPRAGEPDDRRARGHRRRLPRARAPRRRARACRCAWRWRRSPCSPWWPGRSRFPA